MGKKKAPATDTSESAGEVSVSDSPEPVIIAPPSHQPKSPIVSHNEVSSSAQDPPEPSRSPSPSPGPRQEAQVYSWHQPSLAPASSAPAPLMSGPGSVVPLLLPACSYPSLSHPLVYMNPFMPPCQSALAEKKKRNRTFIDPVSEVGFR